MDTVRSGVFTPSVELSKGSEVDEVGNFARSEPRALIQKIHLDGPRLSLEVAAIAGPSDHLQALDERSHPLWRSLLQHRGPWPRKVLNTLRLRSPRDFEPPTPLPSDWVRHGEDGMHG